MVKLPRVQEGWRHLRQRFSLVLVFLCVFSQKCAASSIVLRDITKKQELLSSIRMAAAGTTT